MTGTVLAKHCLVAGGEEVKKTENKIHWLRGVLCRSMVKIGKQCQTSCPSVSFHQVVEIKEDEG
jgi:hypothetical protein